MNRFSMNNLLIGEKQSNCLKKKRTALNEQVANITQKVKFSYLVAGGAVTLTIIQLFLNILGVL